MLANIDLEKVLFLDMETVPMSEDYEGLSDKWKALWERKSNYLRKEEETAEELYPKAGIFAEFGKAVCVSVGFLRKVDDKFAFRIKSFYGEDEKSLLEGLTALLRKSFDSSDYLLCAHNGKEFDFPFIARRCLINGIKLPHLLDTAGRKPWEIQHLDTLHLWKFGDYKHYTSLDLLTTLFDIPTSKQDMDGSMVWEVYWKDKDLERIVKYCQNDVLSVAQLLLRYKGEELIDPEDVEIV